MDVIDCLDWVSFEERTHIYIYFIGDRLIPLPYAFVRIAVGQKKKRSSDLNLRKVSCVGSAHSPAFLPCFTPRQVGASMQ